VKLKSGKLLYIKLKTNWLNQNYPVVMIPTNPKDCNYQPYFDLVVAHDQKEKELGLGSGSWGGLLQATPGQRQQELENSCKQKKEAALEQARQMAEQKRKAAERAAWDRTPTGRLFNGYYHYATVQMCHAAREGYALVYVSEPEFERATAAVTSIVDKAVKEEPTLNTDALWKDAVNQATTRYSPILQYSGSRQLCQMELMQLTQSSPLPAYNLQKP
jgi:hypothetical protein